MPNKILMPVLFFVVALVGLTSAAVAAPTRLSGSMELRYGSHTATENGSKVLDASHFTQKYSFLAEKSGLLANGRLGKYDLALGYEWSWVDSKRDNGVNIDIENPLDKLLYRGEIELSPGGLPFTLDAFSYDMRSTSFVEEDLSEIFSRRGSVIEGSTVTDIANGTNQITGLTLQAGIANGHYEGTYRNALSTLPRLLIDFRQNDVRDLKSINPRDYTDRNLAFVSLNKKNNWLHYRVYSHDDRIDPTTNYREQSFLLGTIDHREQRKWVNLTNWIAVSTDISYSETLPDSASSNLLFQKRYDINLFARAERTRWQGSNFTNYSRVNDGNSLDRNLYVPLYANGELNRDTAWRFSMIGSRTDSELFTAGVDHQTDDLYVTARIDTFRQARYVFSPVFAAESKQGSEGEGYAALAGAEFYSNPGYRSTYEQYGRYEARWFTGTGEFGREVDYLEQFVEGRIEKDISTQLRAGFGQRFLLANGTYDSTVSNNLIADSDSIINHSVIDSEGTVFRSLTTLYADHRSIHRFTNRVGLTFDYQSSPTLSGLQLLLTHRFDYRKAAWNVSSDSVLGLGDELATTAASLGSGVENYLTNTIRVGYRPSRAVKANLENHYERRTFVNGSDSERYQIRESAEYSLWKINGLMRRLAAFGQEIELVKSLQNEESVGENYTAFTLFTNYYPTRISLLSAKLRYEIDSDTETDTLIAFLSAGLNFQKLQVSLDYSYGDRTAGVSTLERTEHRWEVKVNKQF